MNIRTLVPRLLLWGMVVRSGARIVVSKKTYGIRSFHRAPGRPSRNALARFQNPTEIAQLPDGLHPASVEVQRSYRILTGHASIIERPPQQAQGTFIKFCKTYVHPDAQWAIQHLKFNTEYDGLRLARAIKNNHEVAAVSDGSFSP